MSDVPNNGTVIAGQIETAFRTVQYPGDHCLVVGRSMEAMDVADLLRGRHWRELKLNELVYNSASIFFLTPEAIRFYLPAYLIASVLHYEEVDQIPSSVIFLLRPPNPEDVDGQSRFKSRFGPLTKPQRRAIASFLEYLRDEHGDDFLQAEEASELLRWWAGGEVQRDAC